MRLKTRTVGIAAIAILLAGGGYFIVSKFKQSGAEGDIGAMPDTDPQRAGLESVPISRVSGELMQLPETPSTAIAPAPQGKSQSASPSSNVN